MHVQILYSHIPSNSVLNCFLGSPIPMMISSKLDYIIKFLKQITVFPHSNMGFMIHNSACPAALDSGDCPSREQAPKPTNGQEHCSKMDD